MFRILIVEDEVKIARFVTLELEHEGYEVKAAHDGRTGLGLCESWQPDLMILDLMLPELSGIEVCRRLRQTSDVPIIMLTAKDDVSDKVMGLDMGADDYMTKPVSFAELSGRMRAIMRRRHAGEACDPQAEVFRLGELTFDRVRRQVMRGSCAAGLTERESLLLEFLMQNHERLVTKRLIFEHVWSYDTNPQTNVVDVLVCRLRAKLLTVLNCDAIQTVRGLGYMFKLS